MHYRAHLTAALGVAALLTAAAASNASPAATGLTPGETYLKPVTVDAPGATITSVSIGTNGAPNSFRVVAYRDSSGLPGALVYDTPYNSSPPPWTVNIVLAPGSYHVGVRSVASGITAGTLVLTFANQATPTAAPIGVPPTATRTPVQATSTATATLVPPTGTATPTVSVTPSATPTPTSSALPSSTPSATPSSTPTYTPTPVPMPTQTQTPVPSPTSVPPTATATQVAVNNQPTLLRKYYFIDVALPSERTVYKPRQLQAGLTGLAGFGYGAMTVTNPQSYAGWDVLTLESDPGNGFPATQTSGDWLRLTLNRPAVVAIAHRTAYYLAWAQAAGWACTDSISVQQDSYNGPIGVCRKSFPAGEVVLGGPSGNGAAEKPYWVLVGEQNGQPSVAPSVPDGQTAPVANQTCPAWVHDQYTTVGSDGQVHATWHPPADPVFWCYFRHDHGSNPALAHPTYKPAFGLASGTSEAHPGFKTYVVPDETGHDWVLSHHFGTSGSLRACARFHEVQVALVDRATKELQAALAFMSDFGFSAVSNADLPFEPLSPQGCPTQYQDISPQTGSNRQLPVATRGSVGYEPWTSYFPANAMGLSGLFSANTRDRMTVCNDITCSAVIGQPGASGTDRLTVFKITLHGPTSGNGQFTTDVYGQTGTGIAQYVKPNLNYSVDTNNLDGRPNVECYGSNPTDPFDRPYRCVGDPLDGSSANPEGSITGPN